MTPDAAAADLQISVPPSTSGMTTKVVKGSLWNLVGQIFPLAASIAATPFTIRLLGAEGYGVLSLIILMPPFFVFADLGMSIAATRFASGAFAEGDPAKEGRSVRSAAALALLTSLPVTAALFVLANQIVAFFKVSPTYFTEAVIGLRLIAAAMAVNFLSNIFKAPQLARMRMDTATAITVFPRGMAIILTPIVIYLGFGVAGAVAVILIAGLITLIGHIAMSRRFLPTLFSRPLVDRGLTRALGSFGLPYIFWAIAGISLQNLEKFVLTSTASVESLAYYSVAFTFAMMATMLANAMLDSLVPAFSQLLTPEKRQQLLSLFGHAVKFNLLWLFPAMTMMVVVAKPLFTLWAGEEFGKQSTLPSLILLGGLFFSIMAYVPVSILIAAGRSSLLAKLYWCELVPYLLIVWVLTSKFGIVGAAAAWSIRVLADAFLVSYLSKRSTGVSFDCVDWKFARIALAVIPLFIPILLALFYDANSYWLFVVAPIAILLYTMIVLRKVLEDDERDWIRSRLAPFGLERAI